MAGRSQEFRVLQVGNFKMGGETMGLLFLPAASHQKRAFMEIPPLKVFIIYAHEDRAYKEDLLKSLKLLRKQGLVEAWYDRDLLAGDDWEKVILAHLQSAHLILPIISTDFFNSDFIEQVEIVEAFQRYEKGEAHILPIIARPCRWMDDPHISKLQALPEDGRPIARWESRDDAFESVYDGIKAKILGIYAGWVAAADATYRISDFEKEKEKANVLAAAKFDDLKILEGIGPKIERILKEGGINTWAELAITSVDRLRELLYMAGPRYHIHDTSSWSIQAKFAAEGQWEKLKEYQDILMRGRN